MKYATSVNGNAQFVEWNMTMGYADIMSTQYDRISATWLAYNAAAIGGTKLTGGTNADIPAVSTVANWDAVIANATWTFYTTDGTTAIAANKGALG